MFQSIVADGLEVGGSVDMKTCCVVCLSVAVQCVPWADFSQPTDSYQEVLDKPKWRHKLMVDLD